MVCCPDLAHAVCCAADSVGFLLELLGGAAVAVVVTYNVEAWTRDSFTLRQALGKAVRVAQTSWNFGVRAD